jgi:hypothetical protein
MDESMYHTTNASEFVFTVFKSIHQTVLAKYNCAWAVPLEEEWISSDISPTKYEFALKHSVV